LLLQWRQSVSIGSAQGVGCSQLFLWSIVAAKCLLICIAGACCIPVVGCREPVCGACCAVLCCAVLCCAVLCCAVLCQASLSMCCVFAGQKLVRINLSEQTDMMDLLGADLPVEGGAPGQFAW